MAKYVCIPPYTGTEDLLCIYKMHGRYYIRKPSSLTGERVKTDPRFRKTMLQADQMAKASKIGSRVYAALPAEGKRHALYRRITGEAMYWFKHAWKEDDIVDFLLKKYKVNPPAIQLTTRVKMVETEQPSEVYQPFKNRRSIKALVRNMCDGKRSKRIRTYERYLEELSG